MFKERVTWLVGNNAHIHDMTYLSDNQHSYPWNAYSEATTRGSKVLTKHRHTRVDVQSYCRRNVWPSDTETLKIIDNNPLDHCRITTVQCIAVGHLGSNMYVNHDSVASAKSSQFKNTLVVLGKTARWQSSTISTRVRVCTLNQTKQIITIAERSVTVGMKVGIILVGKRGIKQTNNIT